MSKVWDQKYPHSLLYLVKHFHHILFQVNMSMLLELRGASIEETFYGRGPKRLEPPQLIAIKKRSFGKRSLEDK